jgi:spermidine synthase
MKNIQHPTFNAQRPGSGAFIWIASLCLLAFNLNAALVFEKFSPYHEVQVIDEDGMRMLSFNGTRETRMSIDNPLEGHFEYTEYFHTPWIWNRDIHRVLMIGLGGGSTQRAYQHYYTNVTIDTVEIDPVVIEVAKKYFGVQETPQHKIHNEDGRVFLKRTAGQYDVLLMDAYTSSRYGSSIPPHLTTKEFFTLAAQHLTTNGVLAYNVIGQTQGWKADIVGGIYRTLKEVFPQVYLFPAKSSMNVVIVATKSSRALDQATVQRNGVALVRAKVVQLPAFEDRLLSFVNTPPPAAANSPVLTDDRAPVDSLMRESTPRR